jgi:hypothetical protein
MMFKSLEETVPVVEGAYKKRKLFYYYDKTLLITDVIWTLFIKKISLSVIGEFTHSYAGE